jgi:hypothetical protein
MPRTTRKTDRAGRDTGPAAASVGSYKASGAAPTVPRTLAAYSETTLYGKEHNMPYILAWLLGVPAFVLILIWFFAR